MSRYIFLRTAWMKHYKGVTDTDIPTGAGSWVEEHHDGQEVCNYLPIDNFYYGYARIQNGRDLRLENLGAGKNDDFIEGITIVYFAKNPVMGGQYIVGWYKNATLFRKVQKLEKGKRLEHLDYLAKTDLNKVYLVPEDDRTFEIPDDGPGQTNAWYVERYKNPTYLSEVIKYIEDPENYVYRKSKKNHGLQRPWQEDAELRKQIETKAMNLVAEYFEKRNCIVQYRHKENLGWDLEAKSINKKTFLLEVKGLSSDFKAIELTPNEYLNSKKNNKNYRICVVSNILNDEKKKIDIFYWNGKKWINNENKVLFVYEKTSAIMLLKK